MSPFPLVDPRRAHFADGMASLAITSRAASAAADASCTPPPVPPQAEELTSASSSPGLPVPSSCLPHHRHERRWFPRRLARTRIQRKSPENAQRRAKNGRSDKKGDIAGGVDAINGAIDRVKELDRDPKAPPDSGDAAHARGMANFGHKRATVGPRLRHAAERLKKADILSGDIPRSATIEEDRQIARDFIAPTPSFWMWRLHAEEIIRAELDAEKVPVSNARRRLPATAAPDRMRPVGFRSAAAAKRLGKTFCPSSTCLTRIGASGNATKRREYSFQDNETRNYNALLEKIRAPTPNKRSCRSKRQHTPKPSWPGRFWAPSPALSPCPPYASAAGMGCGVTSSGYAAPANCFLQFFASGVISRSQRLTTTSRRIADQVGQ